MIPGLALSGAADIIRRVWPYALAAALIAGAYAQGRSDGRAVMAAKALDQIERVQIAADKARIRIDAVALRAADAQGVQSVEFREINRETVRIIDRPILRTVCGDAESVRLLDRAHAAANRGLAASPSDASTGVAQNATER